MQNCELTIRPGGIFELSATTDDKWRHEVGSSARLIDAVKKIEERGWEIKEGKLSFVRIKGMPESVMR